MKASLATMMMDGRRYMDLLPQKSELSLLLPEVKVARYIRQLFVFAPPLSFIALWCQLQFGIEALLPQAILGTLLIATLPCQGMLWLGWRSRQHLPPSLRGWYRELHAKMEQEGANAEEIKHRPRFVDMGKLLNQAYKVLDSVFRPNRSDNQTD